MLVKTQRLPKPGETVIGGRFMSVLGGKGANQAIAAARFGARIHFISNVGWDKFGDQVIKSFKNERIKPDFIYRDENHPTGVALILIDGKGKNMISVASGANAFLKPYHVEHAESAFANATVAVTQLETSLDVLACTARLAKKHGIPLILDPAPAPDEPIPAEILRDVTCIKPNELEAERLTGIKVTDTQSALKAAAHLLDQGVKVVIVTLGENGCLLATTQSRGKHIPALVVDAVDSTAAGDAFCGVLAYGIGAGHPLNDAVDFANIAAGVSVTRMGAQPSLPTFKECAAFVKGIREQ